MFALKIIITLNSVDVSIFYFVLYWFFSPLNGILIFSKLLCLFQNWSSYSDLFPWQNLTFALFQILLQGCLGDFLSFRLLSMTLVKNLLSLRFHILVNVLFATSLIFFLDIIFLNFESFLVSSFYANFTLWSSSSSAYFSFFTCFSF